jgi:hypothetical protein
LPAPFRRDQEARDAVSLRRHCAHHLIGLPRRQVNAASTIG